MPKTRIEKEATIKTLLAGLKSAKGVVFANFQGLTVAETEELRGNCRQENISVLVAKKTLVKRALAEFGQESVDPKTFVGGIASFMGQNDEVLPAKLVNDFAKKHEAVKLFGGILEGKFIDATMVKSLATLPSKQELLSKLVGSINAPVSGLINVLAGSLRNLVSVLSNIQKAKA